MGYTCFAHTREAIEVRLVVRRVRPTLGSQLALFNDWDYHAMITDRDGDLLQVGADHRRHAVVEQSIAEAKSAGWRICPQGGLANAAWLALAVIALFTVPARLVHAARRLHLRLPANWPWPVRSSPP